ncbi:MAG: hypothetical protein ACRC2R_22245 [Xenococcaceae cyanobacterium]
MSLFNQILGAINNSEQEGDSNQLAGILNTVQQLSGNNQADSGAMQSVMSIVGNYARSALVEKRDAGGEEEVQQTINQFGGTQPNNQAVNALFNAPQLQGLVGEIESRTGIDSNTVMQMLPTLVPLALNFLKTGNNGQGSNSVASSFLDADGDGSFDLGDAMQMASQYLGK